MLDGMAALMGGNTDGSHGGRAVGGIRQAQYLGAGIIVIGQIPGYMLHPDILDAGIVKDTLSRFTAGEAGGASYPLIPGISGTYFC